MPSTSVVPSNGNSAHNNMSSISVVPSYGNSADDNMSSTWVGPSNGNSADDLIAEKGNEAAPLPDCTDVQKQASPLSPEDSEWISGVKLWVIITAVTIIFFLMLLDASIVSTAIPKITSDFHSLENVGWYGAAYQLASATLLPLTGKLYSNFDTKWTFFTFLAFFELGSLLCGISVSSNMLIVGRTVAGMGASGIQNGALTIVAACVPLRKRPALIGIMMGFGQLGIVGGPLIGGVLTQFATWRWCFYINLPIGGAAAILLVFLRLPEPVKKPSPFAVLKDLHNKVDLLGFAIFAPGVVMLLLAVQFGGNQYAWSSPTVIGFFCGAGVLIIIWLAWEYRQKDAAMVPLPMLKQRVVWVSCLTMMFLSAAMFLASYYLPIYFQGVRGKSPAISGVYLLPSVLSQLVSAVVSGKAVGRFGYYLPWSVASGALTAVGYGLLSTLTPSTSTGDWIGFQILVGTGRGLGLQMPLVAVQNTLTQAQIPTAMSLVMFSQTIGGALFLSFGATVLTNSFRTLLEQDVPGIDVEAVVAAGLYNVRNVVPAKYLAPVLAAYSQSVDRVFYMCSGLAGGCFVLAWAMGWIDIRHD